MAPVAPSVKALAEQHGIDISTVAGSGKGGAIKKSDVEALIGSDGSSRTGSSEKSSKKTKSDSSEKSPKKTKELYCPGCGKRTTETDPEPCTGGEFGHPPIAYVSTDELDGPAENLTPAPPSGE